MAHLTFLGTGTSQGVPVIGCRCEVCLSEDPRDKRLRTSVMLSFEGMNILVDAGPDLRQQLLREDFEDIEAILFTHQHNDHTAGLDDVRPINFRQGRHMPLYATPSVQRDLKARFDYAFSDNPYPGAPRLEFVTMSKDNHFNINGVDIQPIEISHGLGNWVMGFRFGDLVYITDCKTIDIQEYEKIKGAKILIINALHHKQHYSHLNLMEALAIIKDIEPEQAYLTHLSHHMGKTADVMAMLPQGVSLAYDGLKIGF